jgi:hypothetical protein
MTPESDEVRPGGCHKSATAVSFRAPVALSVLTVLYPRGARRVWPAPGIWE